jgi:putative photosynthetic complex assembly protein
MDRTKYSPFLLGAAALPVLALALYAGTVAVKTPGDPVPAVEAEVVASRTIVFRDGQAGEILVYDQGAAAPFATLDRKQNSFIANMVRLLASERTRRGAGGPETPFTLTKWSNGRLALSDPATGETVEIAAFGHTNAQTFTQLLPEKARF